jgi:hypothetical protein
MMGSATSAKDPGLTDRAIPIAINKAKMMTKTNWTAKKTMLSVRSVEREIPFLGAEGVAADALTSGVVAMVSP